MFKDKNKPGDCVVPYVLRSKDENSGINPQEIRNNLNDIDQIKLQEPISTKKYGLKHKRNHLLESKALYIISFWKKDSL